MALRDVDVEFGSEGPKIIWRLFSGSPTIETMAAKVRQSLHIGAETARLAQQGIPAPDDQVLSAKQQQIFGAHQRWAYAVDKIATRKLARNGMALATLGTDVTDSDFGRATSVHRAAIREITSSFAGTLRPALQRKIRTESALRAFDHLNDTADQPTARSTLEFIGTTIITACVEALFNGLMFKEQMGYTSAIGFAFGIGAALAVIGTVAGIGWAYIKRKEQLRKLGGVALLLGGLAVAGFFLLVMAHYRAALIAGDPDPAVTAQASLVATPFAPAFDASLLPYVFVNLACLWVVAVKAAAMFGWLDLRRRRKAAERAARQVDECITDAIERCDQARDIVSDALDDVITRAAKNARSAKAIEGDLCNILVEHREWRKGVAGSYCACEQEYRETVQSVHPAGTQQPRFAAPPLALPDEVLTLDPALGAAVQALEARSIAVRAEQPALIEAVYGETDQARARLHQILAELEAELRFNRKAEAPLRAVG